MDRSKMNRCLLLLLLLNTSCSTEEPQDPVSFYKGYTWWKNTIKSSDFPYNAEQVIEGIRAAAADQPLQIKEETIVALLDRFRQDQTAKNLAEAELMLSNLPKDWIEVIPSRLYYLSLKPGEEKPPSTNQINLIYRVSVLQDGALREVFSTGKAPMQVNLEYTIPGFAQGVNDLHIGEKRVICMHPDLAEGSYPELLNKLLVIEVERQKQ